MANMQGEQFTVVWRTPTLKVVSRVQHVADAEAAVLAVQIDRGGAPAEMEVVAVFKGWPEEADDFEGDWLSEEEDDEPMSNETLIVQRR